MTAAVWSTPPDVCAIDFPAKTDPLHVQPPPVANHWKAFMAYNQRWQVSGVVCEETTLRAELYYSKKYVGSILSQLPPRSCTSQHLCAWSGQARGMRF